MIDMYLCSNARLVKNNSYISTYARAIEKIRRKYKKFLYFSFSGVCQISLGGLRVRSVLSGCDRHDRTKEALWAACDGYVMHHQNAFGDW